MPLRLWWVVVSAALMIVGAIGPWATVFILSVSGLEGDGWLVLVPGVIVLAMVAVHRRRRSGDGFRPWWPFAVGLAATAIATATAIYDVVNIESVAGDELGIVSVGWGLWMAVVASVSAMLALVAAMIARNEGVSAEEAQAMEAVERAKADATLVRRYGLAAMDDPAAAATHPIRLVVTDDLDRSRLTVAFRLLLAIPHLFWLSLWSMVAFVIVVMNWFATLVRRRSPDSLHNFLAGYFRYTTHVLAYVLLAANPFPAFFLGSVGAYPVDLDIDPPAEQPRAKTGFRLVLAFPAMIIAGTLLLAAFVAAFFGWFAALVRGRYPRGLRDLTVWALGYYGQMRGYRALLAERYPYSGPEAFLAGLEPPGVDERLPGLVNDGDLRRSRVTVFFRLPLAFPHFVWLLGWAILAVVVWLLNWFATLALGRSPRPFARFLSAFIRYTVHVSAFFYLIGNQFPGFLGKPGTYPVDARIDPFPRQSRWITFGRIPILYGIAPLALPAILLWSYAIGTIVGVAALLGWFAALVTGRMPAGLQRSGAYALGYAAQAYAYWWLLTDRHPHTSPQAVFLRPDPVAAPVAEAADEPLAHASVSPVVDGGSETEQPKDAGSLDT